MAAEMHPARQQIHVDEEIVGDLVRSVVNGEGEHMPYDSWCLSIMFLEYAVFHIPDSDTNKPRRLYNLSAFEEAVLLTLDEDPAKAGRLSNLGNSYLDRFHRFRDDGDIDRP
jgi:hypothetical protein